MINFELFDLKNIKNVNILPILCAPSVPLPLRVDLQSVVPAKCKINKHIDEPVYLLSF